MNSWAPVFPHSLKTLETMFPDKSVPKCQYGLWSSVFIAGLHSWMRFTLWLLLAFLTLLYFYTTNGTQQAKGWHVSCDLTSILNSKKAFIFSLISLPLSLANTLMQFVCYATFLSFFLSSVQAHFWLLLIKITLQSDGLQHQHFLYHLSVSSSAWISDLLLLLPCLCGVYVVREVLTFAAYVGRLTGCWRRRFLIQVNGCRPQGCSPLCVLQITLSTRVISDTAPVATAFTFTNRADRHCVDAPAEFTR